MEKEPGFIRLMLVRIKAILYERTVALWASMGDRRRQIYRRKSETVIGCERLPCARPLLRSLHWLPVSQRIESKVAALTYKIRSTSHPAYLHSLLSNHISGSTATLRSASRPLLHVPRTRTVYGSRTF